MDVRNSKSLFEFQSKVASNVPQSIKQIELYYVGKRFLAVIHARLRMGRIQLNAHLFYIGVSDTPDCKCGHGIEDVWHYFFACPLFVIPRDDLHTIVVNYAPFSLATILFGASDCSLESNKTIFLAVHNFILKTKRFQVGAIT